MEPGVVGDCTLWDGLQALWDGIFRQRSLRRAGRHSASPVSAAHLRSREPALKAPVGEPAQRQRGGEEDPHLGPLERPEATRRLVSDVRVKGRSESCEARLEL